MNLLDECRAMNDAELEQALKFLAEREKHGLAKLLAHLAEYDRRQLCVKRGHSTLYHYSLQVLGYDEGGAFRRIRAARVVRRWPEVLEQIERGVLHLTALVVLSPILKDENRRELLRAAQGKTRRELDAMVAEVLPRAPMADFSRRQPVAGGWSFAVSAPVMAVEAIGPAASATGENTSAVSSPPSGAKAEDAAAAPAKSWEWQAMVPVAVGRVRIGFDAATAVMSLIDRARQILRHKYPEGRLEDVLREALEILLERKDPQRRFALKPAATRVADGPDAAPEPRFLRGLHAGRYIPAWVKRAAWERDGGRCAWRFDDGTLCGSKDWLEFDHVRPFAKGGRSDSPRNVRLLCRAHNQLASEAAGLKPAPDGASPRRGGMKL
jgi:hypothetical protein